MGSIEMTHLCVTASLRIRKATSRHEADLAIETSKPVMTVDEAVAADRAYFDEHPDEEEYIREFVPGEFGAATAEDPAGLPLCHPCLCDATGGGSAGRALSESDDDLRGRGFGLRIRRVHPRRHHQEFRAQRASR